MYFTDDVKGRIVGPMTYPYEFWRDGTRVAKEYFATDAEAIEWIKSEYPDDYNQGIEMRCYE